MDFIGTFATALGCFELSIASPLGLKAFVKPLGFASFVAWLMGLAFDLLAFPYLVAYHHQSRLPFLRMDFHLHLP